MDRLENLMDESTRIQKPTPEERPAATDPKQPMLARRRTRSRRTALGKATPFRTSPGLVNPVSARGGYQESFPDLPKTTQQKESEEDADIRKAISLSLDEEKCSQANSDAEQAKVDKVTSESIRTADSRPRSGTGEEG